MRVALDTGLGGIAVFVAGIRVTLGIGLRLGEIAVFVVVARIRVALGVELGVGGISVCVAVAKSDATGEGPLEGCALNCEKTCQPTKLNKATTINRPNNLRASPDGNVFKSGASSVEGKSSPSA